MKKRELSILTPAVSRRHIELHSAAPGRPGVVNRLIRCGKNRVKGLRTLPACSGIACHKDRLFLGEDIHQFVGRVGFPEGFCI